MSFGRATLQELHSGVLHKVGGRVKTWHKRWMVLRSDMCLYYYKDPHKSPQGSISLKDPQSSIRDGTKTDTAWPKHCDLDNTLVLTTSSRIYYMFAESLSEAEVWKEQLEKAIEQGKEKNEKNTPKSVKKNSLEVEGGWGPCSARAADLQKPQSTLVDANHNPKHYRKKDRRLPTRRFNEAISRSNPDDHEQARGSLGGGGYDGELDATEFEVDSSSMCESESLYALAGTDEINNPDTSGGTSTTCTSSSASPSPRVKRVSQTSVDVHESLYDLVAQINSETEHTEPQSSPLPRVPTPDTPILDVYEQVDPGTQPADTYEPVNPPATSSPVADSIRLQPLPAIPIMPSSVVAATNHQQQQQQQQLYEELDNHTPVNPANLYEDVGDKSNRLGEADSSGDEEDTHTTAAADGPPLPSRGDAPPVPPKQDGPPLPPRAEAEDPAPLLPPRPEQEGDNKPALPPRVQEDHQQKKPVPRVPRTRVSSSSSSASSSSSLVRPVISPPKDTSQPTAAPTTAHEEQEDIYDDTVTVMSSTSANTAAIVVREGNNQDQLNAEQPSSARHDVAVFEPPEAEYGDNTYEDMEATVNIEQQEENGIQENGSEQQEMNSPTQARPQPPPATSPKSQSKEVIHRPAVSSDVDQLTQLSSLSRSPNTPTKTRSQFSVSFTSTSSSSNTSSPSSRHSPGRGDQGSKGMSLFYKRAQVMDDVSEEFESNLRVRSMLLPDNEEEIDRVRIAETLREVEQEKLAAREERLRWERERLKMEEEMRKLAEEKERLRAELERARNIQ